MTSKDDITRMARAAGFVGFDGENKCLRQFAALVAAAELERIIAANAPEIERINAYIKELEEAMPPRILRSIQARGNT